MGPFFGRKLLSKQTTEGFEWLSATLVVEGNSERPTSVAFSALRKNLPHACSAIRISREALEAETKSCAVQTNDCYSSDTKPTWSLNFDVNAFEFVDKVRITMKYPNSIPLCHASGELFPGNAHYRIVLSSVGTKWNDVVVEERHVPSSERADVMYKRHVIAINIGHSITWEFKKEGRFQRFFKARGAISFFPSHQPFSGRLKVERGVFADVLYLALDHVFVSRVAVGLELDSDRIELIEQRRGTDPTLRHIALALRAGVQTSAALDRIFGEGFTTALTYHLLIKYGSAVLES